MNLPAMTTSSFGTKLTSNDIGINLLMKDLACGLQKSNHSMLGGGNPGYVPQVLERLRMQLSKYAHSTAATQSLLSDYSAPAGDDRFREALAHQLRARCGWNVQTENIMLANGSQSAFFCLFNLFAGRYSSGKSKQIALPLMPEYIGYRDTGVHEGMFRSFPPKVALDEKSRRMKYHIDWQRFQIDEQTAAICVSRPCNPTGNVLTDAEIDKLHTHAVSADIPLIIDNAYGAPFPDILFEPSSLLFDKSTILILSLSKFGIPAGRTGIVIANEEIIEKLAAMNAVLALAPNAIAPRLICDLVEDGDIFTLSKQAINPFYARKSRRAQDVLDTQLKGYPYYLHRVQGGIFLWLWLPKLPCTDRQLYSQLLQQGVTVVPGSYFFSGLDEAHAHQQATIRISYAGDDDVVESGLTRIAECVRRIYDNCT